MSFLATELKTLHVFDLSFFSASVFTLHFSALLSAPEAIYCMMRCVE
jgi:hypothetical protein